jgi:tRNA uridine 5-carbamoylmethylation protein Kti12
MIGLPGSGKSYVAETIRISRKYDFNGSICSTDDVIENIATDYGLTYNDCFKDLIDFAVRQYNRDVAMCVAEGCDIILDQTNLTAKSRARKLAAIPKSYKKIAVVVPTQIADPARWQKQLNRPGKTIPVDVLNEMVKNFQYPSFEEGFDEIWTETTDSDGNLFLNKKTS